MHNLSLHLQNIHAMKASFAEPELKEAILAKLYDAYGISHPSDWQFNFVLVFAIFALLALILWMKPVNKVKSF